MEEQGRYHPLGLHALHCAHRFLGDEIEIECG